MSYRGSVWIVLKTEITDKVTCGGVLHIQTWASSGSFALFIDIFPHWQRDLISAHLVNDSTKSF